ncbi:MAG TPA: DUF6777 domain-containing protein, partial [Acidimicrobiales bacterium]|nr:DUF6777 domain-containing protein [Acidimicrobiales bacterium]
PAAPPAAPPPAAPHTPSGSGDGGGGGRAKLIVGIVAVVALIVAAVIVIDPFGGDQASADTVELEALGVPGANPFTASIAPTPSATLRDFAAREAALGTDTGDDDSGADESGDDEADAETDDADGPGRVTPVGYVAVDGAVPGIYGGTLDEASCDVDQLTGFLSAEPDKAAAWAAVIEIDSDDVAPYLASLTPVHLGADTRVVSHGYADGEATPRQSVLQRGTAVLVDERGVPRVNCYAGNPLTGAEPVEGEEVTGEAWPGFAPDTTALIEPAAQPVAVFELEDVATGERFERPAGSRGDADRPAEGTTDPDRPAEQDVVDDGPIDPNEEYDTSLEDDRVDARYTVEIPDGAVVTLTVANNATSVRRVAVTLSEPGTQYLFFRVAPGEEETAEVVFDHEGGTVLDLAFTEGPAAFTFEVGVSVQDDAGQGGDAGGDLTTAFPIALREVIDGRIADNDTIDSYTVDIEPGVDLLLQLTTDASSPDRAAFTVRLDGDQVFFDRVPPGQTTLFSLLLGSGSGGQLQIDVSEPDALYRFAVETPAQSDGGEPGDAGDDLAEARVVEPTAGPFEGEVGERDPADWYELVAPGPLVLEVANDVESPDRVAVTVNGNDGNQIAFERVNRGATTEIVLDVAAGDVIRIEFSEGRAQYSFGFRPSDGDAAE